MVHIFIDVFNTRIPAHEKHCVSMLWPAALHASEEAHGVSLGRVDCGGMACFSRISFPPLIFRANEESFTFMIDVVVK